jgi:hypothetical protein
MMIHPLEPPALASPSHKLPIAVAKADFAVVSNNCRRFTGASSCVCELAELLFLPGASALGVFFNSASHESNQLARFEWLLESFSFIYPI